MGCDKAAADARINKGRANAFALRKILKSSQLPMKLRVPVFESAIISTTLYASEILCLNQATARRFSAIERSCLLRITGLRYTDHVTSDDLRRRCGIDVSFEQRIREKRLRFFGHVLRHPELPVHKAIFSRAPASGSATRRKGRRRTILHDMHDELLQIHADPHEDRQSWNAAIRAYVLKDKDPSLRCPRCHKQYLRKGWFDRHVQAAKCRQR